MLSGPPSLAVVLLLLEAMLSDGSSTIMHLLFSFVLKLACAQGTCEATTHTHAQVLDALAAVDRRLSCHDASREVDLSWHSS
jgi:hypothetical protein